MKLALALPILATLAACGAAPGFLNTDVPEPAGMKAPQQQGTKYNNNQFQEGTLTYVGKGEIHQIYASYVNDVRAMGWNLSTSDGDASKGYQVKFIKDVRTMSLSIMSVGGTPPDPTTIQITIKVNSGAPR